MLLVLFSLVVQAQDPFFMHFNGAESQFNPAMTGYKGSRSLGIKYKSQWGAGQQNIAPFRTALINFEESVPCQPLDYGAAFGFDQEGDGRLTTLDLGAKVAGGISFGQRKSLTNLRFGINFQASQKFVDFSRFVFSDQLDPKYGLTDANGNLNPTDFVAPNDGRSRVFFTPVLGFVVHHLLNREATKSFSIQFGGALHNAYSLRSPRNGHTESLLGLSLDIPNRYNGFLRLEYIPFNRNNNFVSLRPSVFFQQQEELGYLETGLDIGFSQMVQVGIYHHFNHNANLGNRRNDEDLGFTTNTRWMSLNLNVGQINAGSTGRFDFGAAYSWNVSGLKNFTGPAFELSLTYHWGRSWFCKGAGGKGLDYPNLFKKRKACPTWNISPRQRMYENIWYKTLNFKQ
jgi:type IX secretion system PorP/SprF family membrane protein